MDAFPSIADLVLAVATTAFLLCYAVAVLVQVWRSREGAGPFGLVHVAYAVIAGLAGSVLSFLALHLAFGHG